MPRVAALVVLAVVAAGCGGGRTSRNWVRCNDLHTFCQTVTPQLAIRQVRAARREWLGELHADARKDPQPALRRRLRRCCGGASRGQPPPTI